MESKVLKNPQHWVIGDVSDQMQKCESMGAVEKKLKEMGIVYKRQRVEEGGIYVDQLFFHNPDGFMIEICNCDNLPVIPIAGQMIRSCSRLNLDIISQKQIQAFVHK